MKYSDPGQLMMTARVPRSAVETERVAHWLAKPLDEVKAAAKAAKVRGMSDPGGKPVLACKLGIYHKLPAEASSSGEAAAAGGGAAKAKASTPAEAPAKKRARTQKTPAPSKRAASSEKFTLKCDETVSHHESAAAAAMQAWKWAKKKGLTVISGAWSVKTRRYGWQEAYNVMVPVEGQNWDPEAEFQCYVIRTLVSSAFEAKGEGSRITVEKAA